MAVTASANTAGSPLAEDKWIAQSLASVAPPIANDDEVRVPPPLRALRSSCRTALSTMRIPTSKNEEYRFTDVSPLLQHALELPSAPSEEAVSAAVAARPLERELVADVILVDGIIDARHSSTDSLPKGVYLGPLINAPEEISSVALGAQTRGRGGPFATLNGALARDVVVLHVPAGMAIPGPIRIMHFSSSAAGPGVAAAAPRLLAYLEERAEAEIIEEFAPLSAEGKPGGKYAVFSVAEVELDDEAALRHSYVELEAQGAVHLRATLVNQGRASRYALTEARLGGSLTRHDLGVDQLGGATETEMQSFLLAGEGQLHDLHSKLRLDHPGGRAEQLHKCISAHPSARGVFDGNVRVNRLAQRTDAQQLSRNLLLAPRATVNVKPNLQIVADDVKCTHGCTVSDLSEDELFYMRARGIDETSARQMLVYSFGREVVLGLKDKKLMDRVEAVAKQLLSRAVAQLGSTLA
jgi:Fe-S cluster assembly protein SufD